MRNVPAALYKALGGFATNGVNMTKLESYMVEGEFSATSSTPTSTAIPSDRGVALRWRSWPSSREEAEDPRRLSGAPVPRDVQGRED